MNKFYSKTASLDHVTGLVGQQLDLVGKTVLLQLQLDQTAGHGCAMDRAGDLLHTVGNRADMVLVPVGDEHAPQLFCILDQVGKVRDDQIDTVHILIRETDTAVYHDHISAVFQYRDVFADLIQSTQGNDF